MASNPTEPVIDFSSLSDAEMMVVSGKLLAELARRRKALEDAPPPMPSSPDENDGQGSASAEDDDSHQVDEMTILLATTAGNIYADAHEEYRALTDFTDGLHLAARLASEVMQMTGGHLPMVLLVGETGTSVSFMPDVARVPAEMLLSAIHDCAEREGTGEAERRMLERHCLANGEEYPATMPQPVGLPRYAYWIMGVHAQEVADDEPSTVRGEIRPLSELDTSRPSEEWLTIYGLEVATRTSALHVSIVERDPQTKRVTAITHKSEVEPEADWKPLTLYAYLDGWLSMATPVTLRAEKLATASALFQQTPFSKEALDTLRDALHTPDTSDTSDTPAASPAHRHDHQHARRHAQIAEVLGGTSADDLDSHGKAAFLAPPKRHQHD